MVLRIRLAGPALIATLLLGALQVHAAAKPNPKAVNLTLKDLPAGFTVESNVSRNNAQEVKAGVNVTVAQENKQGRVLSSDIEFSDSNSRGLQDVESSIVRYRADSYAESAYTTEEEESHGLPTIFNQMPIDPVGLGSFAYIGTQKQADDSLTAVEIGFTRGPYMVVVTAYGVTGGYDPLKVYKLAKEIDTRILMRV